MILAASTPILAASTPILAASTPILAASTAELMLRMLVSLAVIAAVAFGMFRLSRGRFGLGAARADIAVHARHQLSRAASVAVVRAGERYFLVGVTDQGVNLLAEGPDLVTTGTGGALVDGEPGVDGDSGAGTPVAPGEPAPVPSSPDGTSRRRTSRRRERAQLRAHAADGGGRGGAGKRHRRAGGPAPSGMSVIEALRERTVRRN